jgi:hypothetical protein
VGIISECVCLRYRGTVRDTTDCECLKYRGTVRDITECECVWVTVLL